jgi:hypothetical protein
VPAGQTTEDLKMPSSANGYTANNQRVGNVAGTPVTADLNSGRGPYGSTLKFVTLSANYTLEDPGGFLIRPAPGAPAFGVGKTVPSGTRLQLFGPEADALVTAGYAAYS